MPDRRRFYEGYDPDPPWPDLPDPRDYMPEPPDEDEPEENVPDAVADRLSWDLDDQRDYAEEAYLREFCPACGTSPCESATGHAGE